MTPAAWIALAQLANNLLSFLVRQREAATQAGAWNEEERQQVEEERKRLFASHAWLTDSEGGS